MKKYLVLISVLGLLASCGENKKGNEEKVVVEDTIQAAIVSNSPAETPPSLAPEELKDDSVFVNGSIPTSWENAGFSDEKGFKLFLKQVQLWVMDNDKEKLASIITYPLKNIKDQQQLIEKYDSVFTKRVKMSFATLHFNQIFRNSQGAMIGDGNVWFRQDGKDFKIIAINN